MSIILNDKVISNFAKTKLNLFFYISLGFLLLTVFLKQNILTVDCYVDIQKNLFFYLNKHLSKLSVLQFNLTQLGDAFVLFSFLTIFIIYAPRIWEVIITSSLITLVFSLLLKKIFSIPRPAVVFSYDDFTIIGRVLSRRTSLPSGHTSTIFTIITIFLFAFMPKKNSHKIIGFVFAITFGLIISLSRVAVGAHYPLDVLMGALVGYICGLIGIVANNRFHWGNWFKDKKYDSLLILFLIIDGSVIVKKMLTNNLWIFYFSLLSISLTLCLIVKKILKEYVKKGN